MSKVILPADVMRASVEFWCRVATAQMIFAAHMMGNTAARPTTRRAASKTPMTFARDAAPTGPETPDCVVEFAQYRKGRTAEPVPALRRQ